MALIGSPVLNNFRRSRRRATWFKRSEKMNSVQARPVFRCACKFPLAAQIQGIDEVRSAHAPGPVCWAGKQFHPTLLQFRAHCVNVFYPDAELKARTRVSPGNDSRLNNLLRIFSAEQIDDHVLELEGN
jgi:hypothetical protein